MITADQLRQIRMLKESAKEPVELSEDVKQRIGQLGTPEGQEELRKVDGLSGT